MSRGVLASVFLLLGSLAGAAEGPRLVVEPGAFDFGRVRPGSVLKTTFSLTNAGTGALAIERISRDCGCTVVEGWRSRLEPGEATQMRLELTIDARRKPGPFVRSVVVKSNDVTRTLVPIEVRAEVVAP